MEHRCRGAADAAAVLGQRIKVARAECKWTARELADRIGVDRRTVARPAGFAAHAGG